jgi:hypothetical protein
MENFTDPWFIAMVILLVLGGLLSAYAVRGYVKDWIILAMALPPAIFRKVFGPPRH